MTKLCLVCFICLGSTIFAQQVQVIKITDFQSRIKNNTDTTYVINFWATWCAPCVKELPDFDSLNNNFKNTKLKVILITLDFKEDLHSKVLPFLNKKNIKSEVNLLDEINGNYFIPIVSEQWSGAIPATLIINQKQNVQLIFEKKMNYQFLVDQIANHIH